MYIRFFIILLLGLLGWILLSQFPNRPIDMIVWDDFSLDWSMINDVDPLINSGKDLDILYKYANVFDKKISWWHSNSFYHTDRDLVWSQIQLLQYIKPTQVMEVWYEWDKIIFFIPSFLFSINDQDAYTKKNILYTTTWVTDLSILKIWDLELDIDAIRWWKKYQVVLDYLESNRIKTIDGDDVYFSSNYIDDNVTMYQSIVSSDTLKIKFYIDGNNLLDTTSVDRWFETWSGEDFVPQECNKLPSVTQADMRWYYETWDITQWARAVWLYATNREACIKYTDLDIPLETNKTYLLALDYKSITSWSIMISYTLQGSKDQKVVDAYFPIENTERKAYTHFFTTNLFEPTLSSIHISVLGVWQPVETLFDNLRLYPSTADMFGNFNVKITRSSSYIAHDNSIVEYNNNWKRYYRWVLHNLHDGVFVSMDRLYDDDFVFVATKYNEDTIDDENIPTIYRDLMDKNLISVVWDKYMSDLYDRGIVNHNIPKPAIYDDHLFGKEVKDALHYDGEWNNVRYINTTELCGVWSEICKPNLDGSFDISFVIWKKVSWIWKLIYVASLLVIWYLWIGRRYIKKIK